MANKKLDDCYFYYYSTCYKGDGCAFRHEENALGCETVCSNWKTGNCQNVHCPYRHMLLKKNRKTIPCYWESQPNGCRKPHCPFMHSKGKPEGSSQDTPNVSGSTKPIPGVMPKNIAVDSMHEGLRRPNPSTLENDLNFASPPVDPLVVKFEEESDNELDIPSPCKSVAVQSQNKSWVKTLEEIRLEKIQELSAAFYSFTEGIEVQNPNQEPGNVMMDVLNKAIVKDLGVLTKTTNRTLVKSTVKRKSSEDGDSLGFRVLTLAEIRQKRQKKNQVQEPDSTSETEEKVTADVFSDDMRIEESSSQSRISGASSAVVHRVINIGKPLESSATSGFQGKNPSDIQSPEESSDIDVSHSEIQNIIGCQKLSQENVTKSTNLNVPQKGMSSKISFQESISPKKVDQCEDASKKLKEINVVNPLQQSTKVADDDASQIQKLGSVNVTKPLLQDVCLQNQNVDVTSRSQQNVEAASKNQQNPDLLSRSQQSVDVPSRNEQNVDVLSKNQQNVDGPSKNLQIVDTPSSVQQVVDTPPKNKPIRLKRNMRLNTQEEQDQGAADSAKRPRTNEASFSLNSSQSDELDQSNLSNPGEMDTDDILNGIDELLGN